MRGKGILILFLGVVSLVSGNLLSKATLVGRTGINLFYKEYKFLKVWWQGSLLVFAALLLLFILHNLIQKRLLKQKARTTYVIAAILAIVGLYFTYNDFRHTLTHRLLGERFHLGAYLFWIGWLIISIFFFIQKDGAERPKELTNAGYIKP